MVHAATPRRWERCILLESGDAYARTFADRSWPFDDVGFGEYHRVAGGDNLRLMTRNRLQAVSTSER
jgi:hypothetical protein